MNSPRVLGHEETIIKITLKGLQGPLTTQGSQFDGIMPGHETQFSDRQIAEVLSYVRAAWGHQAGDLEEETCEKSGPQ